jgi:hypothetical protein
MVWLAAAVFALLLGLATKPAVRLWRRGTEPPSWQSKPIWWRRSIPTVVGTGWMMLVAVAIAPFAMADYGLISGVFTVVLAVALVAILLGFGLWGSVALFARPTILVPPTLRRSG